MKPDYPDEMKLNCLVQKKTSLIFSRSLEAASLPEVIKKILRPPYFLIRRVSTGFKYQADMIKRKLSDKKFHRKDALYAFYDLEVMSASFDIIPFLVLAERVSCTGDWNRSMSSSCLVQNKVLQKDILNITRG